MMAGDQSDFSISKDGGSWGKLDQCLATLAEKNEQLKCNFLCFNLCLVSCHRMPLRKSGSLFFTTPSPSPQQVLMGTVKICRSAWGPGWAVTALQPLPHGQDPISESSLRPSLDGRHSCLSPCTEWPGRDPPQRWAEGQEHLLATLCPRQPGGLLVPYAL